MTFTFPGDYDQLLISVGTRGENTRKYISLQFIILPLEFLVLPSVNR